jgi:pimeloyl-ACP methyl ester carboxylesterase
MKRLRLTFGRVLAATAALALLAYGGAIVWLVANETRLVFHARSELGDARPALPFEQVDDTPAEGTLPTARAWVMPAANGAAAPWVVFLHGNDANLSTRMNLVHYERLRALGVNVIAPEYRGFGGVSGVPTEGGLADDARHWYDYLRAVKHVAPEQIVIYGWSLGSAVAVNLASRVSAAAVVLEGAPASIVSIGEQRYPLFPVRLLIRNPFESVLKIGAVHAPLLFLHSPEDIVVPIAEGRKLFEAAAAPKQFVEVSGGHVYASEKDPRFFPTVQAFLRAQHLLP